MNYQDELDGFFEKWGGRPRVVELIESTISAPGDQFAEELSVLVESNYLAKRAVIDIVKVAGTGGQLDDTIVPSFAGTVATHGTSVADDFFKAKSPEYLWSAELEHELEAAARNQEEGWPDEDRDIGDCRCDYASRMTAS